MLSGWNDKLQTEKEYLQTAYPAKDIYFEYMNLMACGLSIIYKKSREGEGKGDGYRERETPEGYCENTQNGPPQTNANVNYS